MNISSLQKRLETIEQYTKEIKAAKEMLRGELENSTEWVEANEIAKDSIAKRKKIQDDICSSGPNKRLVEDIKERKEEIKELREIMAAELLEIYKESGSEEFTDVNGNKRKFKISVKVVQKSLFD